MQENLAFLVCISFALYKEIAVKEDPGAWFVLNKTEDIVPLTCILFCFVLL